MPYEVALYDNKQISYSTRLEANETNEFPHSSSPMYALIFGLNTMLIEMTSCHLVTDIITVVVSPI